MVFFYKLFLALGELRQECKIISDNKGICKEKDFGFSSVHYYSLRGGVIWCTSVDKILEILGLVMGKNDKNETRICHAGQCLGIGRIITWFLVGEQGQRT